MHVNERVKKYRLAQRQAGLRPVQLWVPDTRSAGFAAACRHQSLLIAKSDRGDDDLDRFMDAALADMDGWDE